MFYQSIITEGTLSDPDGKPDPKFALPSTINWMQALKMVVQADNMTFVSSLEKYKKIGKRSMNVKEVNTIIEQLFLSLHHLSALKQMTQSCEPADIARLGIVGWYYGIVNAASAMVAAQEGSFQEDHSGKARSWNTVIAANDLALGVFSRRVTSLVKKEHEREVAEFDTKTGSGLLQKSTNKIEAEHAIAQYLKGSAKWYSEYEEKKIKKSKPFKELNVANFRSNKAKYVRDEWLSKRAVGFLHCASRYRGKANYREALFLGYGKGTNTLLNEFCADLVIVLEAFLQMAGAFSSQKLGDDIWKPFVTTADESAAFSLPASTVWNIG